MKNTFTCLLLVLKFAAASPAATPTGSCPKDKCFKGKNDCGVAYGGCWDECGAVPTFTVPLCLSPPTTTATFANITAPVWSNGTQSLISEFRKAPDERYCPMVVCEDKMTMCGSQTVVYGGCYDTCGTKTVTAPDCTRAPVTITANPTKTTTKPKKTKTPCTAKKEWMCAPPGW